MPFRCVHLHQFLDQWLGFLFSTAHHSGRGAVILDQILLRIKIVRVQLHSRVKFLLRLSRQRVGAQHGRVIRLRAIRFAQPPVIVGILRIDRDGFFRAVHRGIVLVQFQVGSRQQDKNIAVVRLASRRAFQNFDGLGILAFFKRALGLLQGSFLGARRGGQRQANQQCADEVNYSHRSRPERSSCPSSPP